MRPMRSALILGFTLTITGIHTSVLATSLTQSAATSTPVQHKRLKYQPQAETQLSAETDSSIDAPSSAERLSRRLAGEFGHAGTCYLARRRRPATFSQFHETTLQTAICRCTNSPVTTDAGSYAARDRLFGGFSAEDNRGRAGAARSVGRLSGPSEVPCSDTITGAGGARYDLSAGSNDGKCFVYYRTANGSIFPRNANGQAGEYLDKSGAPPDFPGIRMVCNQDKPSPISDANDLKSDTKSDSKPESEPDSRSAVLKNEVSTFKIPMLAQALVPKAKASSGETSGEKSGGSGEGLVVRGEKKGSGGDGSSDGAGSNGGEAKENDAVPKNVLFMASAENRGTVDPETVDPETVDPETAMKERTVADPLDEGMGQKEATDDAAGQEASTGGEAGEGEQTEDAIPSVDTDTEALEPPISPQQTTPTASPNALLDVSLAAANANLDHETEVKADIEIDLDDSHDSFVSVPATGSESESESESGSGPGSASVTESQLDNEADDVAEAEAPTEAEAEAEADAAAEMEPTLEVSTPTVYAPVHIVGRGGGRGNGSGNLLLRAIGAHH